MKYLIGFLISLTALAAGADTLQAKVDALNAAPGVLEAWVDKAPVSMGKAGTLYAGRVAWVQVTGAIVEQKGAEVVVRNLGLIENKVNVEEAFWVGDTPAPLKEPVDKTPAVGTDKAILEAVGGVIVKADIQRSAAVGDTPPSATVTGVREVDGKTVEFKAVVYLKGDVLVSSEPTTKALSAAALEPAK